MSIASAQVAVTTTEAALWTADPGGMSASVQNIGATTVYLGPTGVSSATGYPLAAGVQVGIDLGPGEVVFARTASGSSTVAVLQAGVG